MSGTTQYVLVVLSPSKFCLSKCTAQMGLNKNKVKFYHVFQVELESY